MSKALIIRYGAYGDILHMSFLPRLLKDEGYDVVDVETNHKGYQLLAGNPFIDNIKAIEPAQIFAKRPQDVYKYFGILSEGYNKIINLTDSIETNCLAMETSSEYYMSTGLRRQKYGSLNYYDETCCVAGYENLIGKYVGEVHYSDKENSIVTEWTKQFDGKFTILINLSGTGPHKRFVQAEEVARKILEEYKDAHIILTGSPDCHCIEFTGDRISSIVGKFPFRQALLIAKHMSCVIGMESGLMCGADMWETSTIQLMTAASIHSHCRYNPNSLAIQSPAICSPCHKGPYKYYGCAHKEGNPICVYFDVEDIMTKVGVANERSRVTV